MYCEINRSNLSIAEKANQLIIPYKSYKRATKNRIKLIYLFHYEAVIMVLAFYPQPIGKKNALRGKNASVLHVVFLAINFVPTKVIVSKSLGKLFLSNRI